MKMELTAKDIRLLKIMLTLLIMVLMIRFLIFPALEKKQSLDFEREEAETRQEEMQYRIDGIETSRAIVEKMQKELADEAADYSAWMKQQEIDELVTGLAYKHGLFPSRLDIGGLADAALAPYRYSTAGLRGENSFAPDIGASETAGSQSKVEKAAEEAAGQMENGADAAGAQTGAADLTGYIKEVETTINLLGDKENFLALLDDIERNYPSVQVRSFEVDRASYMDTSMELVEETQASLKLTVYMQEKAEDTGK